MSKITPILMKKIKESEEKYEQIDFKYFSPDLKRVVASRFMEIQQKSSFIEGVLELNNMLDMLSDRDIIQIIEKEFAEIRINPRKAAIKMQFDPFN